MIKRRSTCPNCGQEMYRTDNNDNGRTHWLDCWRDRQHHACAVAQVEQARAEAALWRARYMAAHEVLLAVEVFIEATERPARNNGNQYRAMRAAFLAYRASIEAGAPLGWAVAEEPAEATT